MLVIRNFINLNNLITIIYHIKILKPKYTPYSSAVIRKISCKFYFILLYWNQYFIQIKSHVLYEHKFKSQYQS